MAVSVSDIKLYQASVNSNVAANNGGRMSSALYAAALNILFPSVSSAERAAGATHWRKLFVKIANDADESLSDTLVYLSDISTSTSTRAYLAAGTQRGTQTTDISTPRLYGVGRVSGAVTGGVTTSIDVVCETGAGADLVFQDGDKIVIDNGTTREMLVVNGAPSWATDTVTLTLLAAPVSSYDANTPVAAAIYSASVGGTVDNWVETTAAGTYNEGTYPVLVDHIGGVEQTWTVTFTSGTAFTVAGDTVGSVGSGNIGVNFTPTNSAFAKPYFTLYAAGWGGTWAATETLVFQTHPAALPFWTKRVVTAGAAVLATDGVTLRYGRL